MTVNTISLQEDSSPFMPTRSSLLMRLKSWDDADSWREFYGAYSKSIFGLALKCGLTHVEAQEVVQETMIAVAKQMPDFKYDRSIGTFKGLLFTITRRSIGKQLAKRKQGVALEDFEAKDDDDSMELPDPAAGFEQQWDEDWRQNLLTMAMDRVRRRIKPKQYQMFDLYVTQNIPMEGVTRILNANSAQVYMAKLRVMSMIRHEVSVLEKKLI